MQGSPDTQREIALQGQVTFFNLTILPALEQIIVKPALDPAEQKKEWEESLSYFKVRGEAKKALLQESIIVDNARGAIYLRLPSIFVPRNRKAFVVFQPNTQTAYCSFSRPPTTVSFNPDARWTLCTRELA